MNQQNSSSENNRNIVIVTGASGNLGEAVVKKFIDEGYYVIGTVTPNNTAALNFPANKFDKFAVDLMNEEDAEKFINAVIAKHKNINAAVLTVGGFTMGKIADTKTSDIAKQYRLNFETTYNVARPVFTQMLKQGNGRIFIIGSKPGLNAKTAKAWLLMVCQSR